MRHDPNAAILQPDEHVYHLRGTYWRVAFAGRVYRSLNAGRGWTQREARAVAAELSPRVRLDSRNRFQRLHDLGRQRMRH